VASVADSESFSSHAEDTEDQTEVN